MIHCDKETARVPDRSVFTDKPDGVCPVRWALEIADANRLESCGKCVMCREGSLQLSTIISDITSGKGESDDPELILDLCSVIFETADCSMARESADAIRYSLENYREDWDAHLLRKRCPAVVCPSYISYAIKPDGCTGCGDCLSACHEGAIAGSEGLIHVIDTAACTRCGDCVDSCALQAIDKYGAVVPKTPEAPVPVGSFEIASTRRRRRRGQ